MAHVTMAHDLSGQTKIRRMAIATIITIIVAFVVHSALNLLMYMYNKGFRPSWSIDVSGMLDILSNLFMLVPCIVCAVLTLLASKKWHRATDIIGASFIVGSSQNFLLFLKAESDRLSNYPESGDITYVFALWSIPIFVISAAVGTIIILWGRGFFKKATFPKIATIIGIIVAWAWGNPYSWLMSELLGAIIGGIAGFVLSVMYFNIVFITVRALRLENELVQLEQENDRNSM